MKRLLARIGGPQYRMQGNWSLLIMLHKCIAVRKFLAFKSVLDLNHCSYLCDFFISKTKNKVEGKAVQHYFRLKFAPLIFKCILK